MEWRMEVPKIGQKNPAAVLRDLNEALPTLRTIVVVGIHKDESMSVWQSETPAELEKASLILHRFALDELGEHAGPKQPD